MDTGNNFIATQIAQGRLAQGGDAARGVAVPDPAIMSPKAVSYIGIGGSDWGTHVQSEHQLQAMTPSWQVIDNEWVPWSKTALMDDALIDRATQIGENLAAAAKKIQENVAAGTDPYSGVGYQGKKGICPHCNCNDFYIVPGENRAICCVCGLEGELSVEGAFRQPCYWCNRLGERFMPEDEIYNTTFVGNAINHLPGKVAYAIFDSRMLKHWKKDGPDIVSHVHPHDLYEGFDEQWERDLAAGYPAICQADTLEELAEKAGIDVEGLLANVDEYNEMCDNGWDDIFEKEREFMRPLEKGPFYCCKQYCGAYGTLGGVLINHKMEVMTDDYEVIPGLYCVGTDACTIYGDSYNYCIPGNTMGFCLNSGRIAGENAASALFEDAGDEEWS